MTKSRTRRIGHRMVFMIVLPSFAILLSEVTFAVKRWLVWPRTSSKSSCSDLSENCHLPVKLSQSLFTVRALGRDRAKGGLHKTLNPHSTQSATCGFQRSSFRGTHQQEHYKSRGNRGESQSKRRGSKKSPNRCGQGLMVEQQPRMYHISNAKSNQSLGARWLMPLAALQTTSWSSST